MPTRKIMYSTATSTAVLIGIAFGIVLYSAVNNSLGFFTLIPLYFIYRFLNNNNNNNNNNDSVDSHDSDGG